MQLKGIIFDFDGTIADTLPAIFTGFRYCLQTHLGREFSDQEIEALFGPTEEGLIKRLVPDRWQSCYADYLSEYRRSHPIKPFPDLEQALILLQQAGVRLAIGTGKGKGSLLVSLDIVGLGHYFELLEVGSEQGAVKPEIIARILNTWELAANEVAYVGDAVYDVGAARKAGVVALSAAWADSADVAGIKAAQPDAMFRTVAEFIEWVKPRLRQ